MRSSGAAPVPQSGPATTTIADTVYLADGSKAQGNLIITWPAFLTASGTAVAGGTTTASLGANGGAEPGASAECRRDPGGRVLHRGVPTWTGRSENRVLGGADDVPGNPGGGANDTRFGVAGQPVSRQYVNSGLATKANDSAVVHLSGTETISASKSGSEKKDAAMSFSGNALATVDAVAAREIVDPEKFRNGASKIIDGTVDCLNASTWAKGTPQASPVSLSPEVTVKRQIIYPGGNGVSRTFP
jgi:hypothetical protein